MGLLLSHASIIRHQFRLRNIADTRQLLLPPASNKQLYNYTVALDVYRDYIPSFSGHYLSSNVNITLPSSGVAQDHTSVESRTSVPYGDRVLRLITKNQKLHITAFGVLFDFDRADEGITVQSPADLIKEKWWKEAIDSEEPTDVFVLGRSFYQYFRMCKPFLMLVHTISTVGHMATYDKDWLLIVNSIRRRHPTTPV